jgi:hypothetical protein
MTTRINPLYEDAKKYIKVLEAHLDGKPTEMNPKIALQLLKEIVIKTLG